MTHRHPTKLLEAYVDGELSATDTATVQDAMTTCPDCKRAVDELRNLRQILTEGEIPDPDEDYWQEVEALIHAKTIDRTPATPVQQLSPDTRRSLTRAVASFAVAASLFATALILGQYSKESPQFTDTVETSPVFVVAPLQDVLQSLPDAVITEDEQFEWARAIVRLGIPGSPGRMIGLWDLPRKPI